MTHLFEKGGCLICIERVQVLDKKHPLSQNSTMSENSEDSKKSPNILGKLSPILLVLSIVLAFIVGLLYQKITSLKEETQKVAGEQTAVPDPNAPKQVSVNMDQIRGLFDKDVIKIGDKDSKLVFVEVADSSCPYCSIASGKNSELNNSVSGGRFKLVEDGGEYIAPVPEMEKLVKAGKAAYVYMYLNGHGSGEMAAKALYCANDQGKYWEVHDLIMSAKGHDLITNTVKNDPEKSDKLASFLKSVINSSKLQECLDSGKYDKVLESNEILAKSLGVSGTPGFFVNDKNFKGAYSYSDMKDLVESILKK